MKFKINLSFFWMRDSSIWHLAFGMLLFCLLLCLSFKISDESYWSAWGPGDAQTMLSLRQWEEEGWVANKFLLTPQGYAKISRILDEPRLRHHAHGISPQASPLVGPRLRYTHYPSGFLIPYAILFRLGLRHVFFMRMLSVLFSIGTIIFMYILFSKITSPGVSFVAVFFYAMSPPFLGYAHSLANQPIDDLLRFTFMLAILFSTRAASLKQRMAWITFSWIIEFLLSLCSFDSVFFVYLWLIGWDILEQRGFRWKVYLIYALAPLTAHFLQFLQNVWYLGLSDAILDIKGTFLVKSVEGTDFFITMYYLFASIFDKPHKRLSLALIILLFVLYSLYVKFLNGSKDRRLPSLKLLIVLFLCGLPFFLILPVAATMPYQVKQILPSAVLLVSGTIWASLKEFKRRFSGDYSCFGAKKLLFPKKIVSLCLLLFIFLACFISICKIGTKASYYYVILQDNPEMVLAKAIRSMTTKYEPVIFNIDGFRSYLTACGVRGYPQINPFIEYYVGSKLILCFTTPERLTSDLLYLIYRSLYKFSPILVVGNPTDIEKIFSILRKKGAIEDTPAQSFVMDKCIIDLTDYLKWDYVRSKGED